MNKNHMSENKEVKKEVKIEAEVVKDEKIEAPKLRQIIIETNGSSINLVKAEVGGVIELTAILQNLIAYINKPNTETKAK